MGLRWPTYVAMHICEKALLKRPPCGFGPHGTVALSGWTRNNSLSSTTSVARAGKQVAWAGWTKRECALRTHHYLHQPATFLLLFRASMGPMGSGGTLRSSKWWLAPPAGHCKPRARFAARNSEAESRPCCRHCMMRAKSFMVWHEGPATAGFGLWVTARFCALLELAWVAVWKRRRRLAWFSQDAKDAGRFAWFCRDARDAVGTL